MNFSSLTALAVAVLMLAVSQQSLATYGYSGANSYTNTWGSGNYYSTSSYSTSPYNYYSTSSYNTSPYNNGWLLYTDLGNYYIDGSGALHICNPWDIASYYGGGCDIIDQCDNQGFGGWGYSWGGYGDQCSCGYDHPHGGSNNNWGAYGGYGGGYGVGVSCD